MDCVKNDMKEKGVSDSMTVDSTEGRRKRVVSTPSNMG